MVSVFFYLTRAHDYSTNWTKYRASAPPSKSKDYLPADKQYLVTRHVPSHIRASSFQDTTEPVVGEDGWVSTSFESKRQGETETDPNDTDATGIEDEDHVEEIMDFELEDDDLEDNDIDAYRESKSSSGTQKNKHTASPTRTYNLFITYSTAYRVPKFYLSGFNDNGDPLKPDEMFEDIIGDYKDKTVTIEKAPFEENLTLVSIHPCRHANVMRILMSHAEARALRSHKSDDIEVTKDITNLGLADSEASPSSSVNNDHDTGSNEGDDWEEIAEADAESSAIRVDQYLVIFLKFIASVTPGIEHDFTMTAL